MNVREATEYCLSRGFPITHNGIRYIVRKYRGIFKKSFIEYRLTAIYQRELDAYIESCTITPDDGWITTKQASKEFGFNRSYFYQLIRRNAISYMPFGRGEGTMCVRREEIAELYNRPGRNRKENKNTK